MHSRLVVMFAITSLAVAAPVLGQTSISAVKKKVSASNDPGKAISIVLEFIEQEAEAVPKIQGLDLLARLYARIGESGKADATIQQAQGLLDSIEEPDLQRRLSQIESVVACAQAEFQRGVESATRSIDITRQLDPQDPYLFIPLNERGINYVNLSKYDLAIRDFDEAFGIARRTNNSAKLMRVTGNLATVYEELKDFDRAIELNLSALESAECLEHRQGIATISVNLANDYLSINQPDKAREHFKTAISIAGKNHFRDVLAIAYTGLGDIEADANHLELAQAHFRKARDAYKESKDIVGNILIQSRLIALEAQRQQGSRTPGTGEQAKHAESDQTSQARELLALLEEAKAVGNQMLVLSLMDQLITEYQNLSNWQQAAKLLLERRDLALQQWNRENQLAIQKFEQSSIQLQRQQQNNFYLALATVMLSLVALTLLILWRTKTVASRQLQNANAKICQNQQQQIMLERRLGEREKIDSLSMMSAGVMHDFNNFLSAIVSSAELGKLTVDPAHKNQLFDSVVRTGMSAAELTKSLSDYLGQGSPSKSICNLGKAIQDDLAIWQQIAGQHIEVKTEVGPCDCWVSIEPGELKQVISNIVKNSRESIVNDGQIVIALECFHVGIGSETATRAATDVESDQLICELTIRDNGSGMSEKELLRSVDPFFSTKGVGRGMGLASVKGIVERNGGAFFIDSTHGEGTTISIRFPSVDIESTDSASQEEQESQISIASTVSRILFVEDDTSVREGVTQYLESVGFKVWPFEDAESALAAVQEGQLEFDCLVTDFLLPGANGRELAKRIRSDYPNLPTILVSGFAEKEVFESGLFDEFVAKPFKLHKLILSIQKVQLQNANY